MTLLQVHLSVGDGFVMEGLGIASFYVVVEFNISFLDFDHQRISCKFFSACIICCFTLYTLDVLQNSTRSLNLVFVLFCEFLVGEWTADLRTIKGNGFYN